MKKPMYIVLAIFVMIVVVLFASVVPVYAFRPGPPPIRGGVWIGPGWGPDGVRGGGVLLSIHSTIIRGNPS